MNNIDTFRRDYFRKTTTKEDVDRTLNYISELNYSHKNIIHCFYERSVPRPFKDYFYSSLEKSQCKFALSVDGLDLARDSHHYGIETTMDLSKKIYNLMSKDE
jgi:hypothetical protein